MVFLWSKILTFSAGLFVLALLADTIFADPTTTNFLQESESPIVGNSLSARDYGVVGDGVTDDHLAIQKFIDRAWQEKKTAFFPSGEYLISRNIFVNGSVTIQGSVQGMAVFKTPQTKILRIYIKSERHKSPRDLTISHMFFDGIMVFFISKSYKYNFRLANCVFFTSRVPLLSISKQAFIRWDRVWGGVITDVIFLRSKASHGLGISFYKTQHVHVESNIFGLDFNNLDWLASQYHGISRWNRLLEKLYFMKTHYKLKSDQGHFRAALYGNRDDVLTIKGNIFNGSPYTTGFIDHVIYLKGFDGLYVLGNYARGWPSNPWGGLKMRNGENVVVARNYLIDTGILLYTHDEIVPDPLHQGLSNVLIYGNHLVELTNIGGWGAGIMYNEPQHTGKDTNINFCNNTFEIENLNLKSLPTGIHLSNGNKREHHVYKDNVYFGTSLPVVMVGWAIVGAGDLVYENGTCPAKMVSPYQSSKIPNLVIPIYCNQTAFGSACL